MYRRVWASDRARSEKRAGPKASSRAAIEPTRVGKRGATGKIFRRPPPHIAPFVARPSTRAAVLGGEPHGCSYVCSCPVPGHLDKHPSFHIAERGGKVVFICRSGCGQGGAPAALKGRGLWPDCPDDLTFLRDRAGAASSSSSAEARGDGKRDPFRWWRACSPSKIRDSLIPILSRRPPHRGSDRRRVEAAPLPSELVSS